MARRALSFLARLWFRNKKCPQKTETCRVKTNGAKCVRTTRPRPHAEMSASEHDPSSRQRSMADTTGDDRRSVKSRNSHRSKYIVKNQPSKKTRQRKKERKRKNNPPHRRR